MNAFRARQQAKGRIDLLPPEPTTPARRERFTRRPEVVDADFVVIRASATRTSNDNRRSARPAPAPPLSRHVLFRLAAACARLAEAGLQRLPGRAFAGLVMASFLFVFAYAGGISALKAALPGAGPAEPLRVAELSTSLDDRNGMKVLSVYGRLDNASGAVQPVPPLEIRVDGTGKSLQRRVALDAATIPPGASEHFALHIPHGGGKVPKVSVSFVREGAPAP